MTNSCHDLSYWFIAAGTHQTALHAGVFSVQVTTRVVLHVDDVVSTVRWWIILLAVIVGLVLLLLLILLMWKVRLSLALSYVHPITRRGQSAA